MSLEIKMDINVYNVMNYSEFGSFVSFIDMRTLHLLIGLVSNLVAQFFMTFLEN